MQVLRAITVQNLTFHVRLEIILKHQKSSHRKLKSSQNAEDNHLLQLCVILIGGVRFHLYYPDSNIIKYRIRELCRNLLKHDQDNITRMKEIKSFNDLLLNEV